MAEKLTPQQEMAVCNRGGKLLVSAAAGSGKTKVLVDRLMRYLLDPKDPANLDEFLVITYTKAAAAELRSKIASKLTEKIAENPENRHLQQQMQRLYLTKISTVHSFCGDLLREYAYRMDLSADFRVADENECVELRQLALEQVLDQAYETAADDECFRAFVDTQGLGRDDRLVPEIVQKVFDSARCHLDPEKWLYDCIHNAQTEQLTDAAQTVWGKYLLDDLFNYLDLQLEAMRACADAAGAYPELEKQRILLMDTIYQLEHLRQSSSWDEVVARRTVNYGRLVFPKRNPDPVLADRIKAVRAACKKGLDKKLKAFSDPTAQVLEDLGQAAAAVQGLVSLVRQFDDAYSRMKRSRRILDFGDLEHRTLDLLLGTKRSGPTAVASEVGTRFREIMVDEYQDSNAVQDAIFSALTWKRQNCFMVGDVKQSIYQFRLADPSIFLKKYEEYGPAETAEPGQGRKVLLSSNFRSSGGVLAGVNDVFYACMSPAVGGLQYTKAEALQEGLPHTALDEPEVELDAIEVLADTYGEEAAFVADRIAQLLDGTHMVRQGDGLRPMMPEDIVILLRSPGSVGYQYRNALEKRSIRCCTGGGVDLLETAEISTLRAILQTISNPRQDIPLIASLASPVFGFTADDLAAFRSGNRKNCVYEALRKSTMPKAVQFLKTLTVLRREEKIHTLAQLLERIFTLTKMDSIYGAMEGGEERIANLQTFYQLAGDFETNGRRDLNQFLDHLAAMEGRGLTTARDQTSAGAVTLMSIHKSKGLEFPVVFLCGLSREFNRESLRAQVLCDKELGLGLSAVDEKNRVRYPTISKRAIAVKTAAESLSEEMRVLYVAMTRARDRLIMTYAVKNLAKDLSDIAMRSGIGSRELLTRDVSSPGEWILLAAMQRTEAGELFALGGKPHETMPGVPAWKIQVVRRAADDGKAAPLAQSKRAPLPPGTVERLRQALAFQYGYQAATQAPSKQTATQRKGRFKDQEAAEHARETKPVPRGWRKPSFVEKQFGATAYGSAIHAVLQYIRYDACGSLAGVEQEVQRLVREKFITVEQGRMVRCEKIAAFFATELGAKLRTSQSVLREFKFSILDHGEDYGPGLEGEQVLLQGVVDCALLEADGITIVDFKTDFVTEQTVVGVSERYRPQVEAYADALARIYGMDVKKRYLYFFHLDRFLEV